MAEALKTFREGEDILASETNENNQFLLSKLSDNAAQVQQYVEGEVATIKSNVSSVQATLQNNIDGIENTVNATIANLFNAIMPNYANGKAVTAPISSKKYTAPSAGYYVCNIGVNNNSNVRLYINGVASGYKYADGEGVNGMVLLSFTVPLSKGDVIYWSAALDSHTGTFYPCKGL
jgi:hypothetical protein